MHGVQAKQALVGQRAYREQENSRPERPDRALHLCTPWLTRTISPPFCDVPGVRYRGRCNHIPQIEHRQKVRPPLVFTSPEPPHWEPQALALKGTFWWPSQEAAVPVQVYHPCDLAGGGHPLGLSKQQQKPINPTGWTCSSRSQLFHSAWPRPGAHGPSAVQPCSPRGVLLRYWPVRQEGGRVLSPHCQPPPLHGRMRQVDFSQESRADNSILLQTQNQTHSTVRSLLLLSPQPDSPRSGTECKTSNRHSVGSL